jgi:hypothetical protein
MLSVRNNVCKVPKADIRILLTLSMPPVLNPQNLSHTC